MNLTKLLQDARIESIELVSHELYVIYNEDLAVHEQNYLAKEFNLTFINDRCAILELELCV